MTSHRLNERIVAMLTRLLAFSLVAVLLVAAAFAQSPAPQELVPAAPKKMQPAQEHLDLVYADYGDRKMHLDLFLPAGEVKPRPAILVVHGGGWLNGNKEKFHPLAQALSARGYITAAVEYRLGGEAKFPAAIHDCNTATRWLRSHAKKYHIDPERIGAVGGSAGGHLVGLMATARDVKQLRGAGFNHQSSALQAAIVMAGPLELASGPVAEKSRNEPNKSNSNKWLGKTIDEAPELYKLASATTHINRDTPPILFMVGEHDQPLRNLATRQRLRELGIATGVRVYANGKHGCWNRQPWQSVMVDDMDVFFREHFKISDDAAFASREMPWGEMQLFPGRIELTVNTKNATGPTVIPRFNNRVNVIHMKSDSDKRPLNLKPLVKEWSIAMPDALPPIGGDVAGVLLVETKERPYLPVIPRIISATADHGVILPAHEAMTHGENLRYEPQPHKNTVGYWTNVEDWCSWRFHLDEAGRYDVQILQGCGKGHGGSDVAVSVGEEKVTFTVEDTGHFQNFRSRKVGQMQLSAGVQTLAIKPINKAKAAVMDVREVRLIRIDESRAAE